jgi:hypothetical protein
MCFVNIVEVKNPVVKNKRGLSLRNEMFVKQNNYDINSNFFLSQYWGF